MEHVLITGGSRGIGAAAVRAFSKEGFDISFFYEKNHTAAHAVAAETGARAICCDVADGQAVADAFRATGFTPAPALTVQAQERNAVSRAMEF